MTDFFEIRVENLEPKVEIKNLLQLPRNPSRKPNKGNGKNPTPVS